MLTLTPAQAADQLGVSSTALRRASPIYEQHFGALPREGRGGRLWPAEALERMRLAFQAVHQNQMVSISAALEVLSAEGQMPVVQASGRASDPDGSTDELLRALLAEVRASRAENAELAREVSALRSQLDAGRILVAGVPAEVKVESGAPRSPEGSSRRSQDLDGVTVLKVAAVALPSRLKNSLRWAPSRYTDLEAVLRGTHAVRLDTSSGKEVWRDDGGKSMRPETVSKLLDAGVLVVKK